MGLWQSIIDSQQNLKAKFKRIIFMTNTAFPFKVTSAEHEIGAAEVAKKYDDLAKDKKLIKKHTQAVIDTPTDLFGDGVLSDAIGRLGHLAGKVVRKTLDTLVKERIIENKLFDLTEFVIEAIAGREITTFDDLRTIFESPEDNGIDGEVAKVMHNLKPRERDGLLDKVAQRLDLDNTGLFSSLDTIKGIPYMLLKFGVPIASQQLEKLIDSLVGDLLTNIGFAEEEEVLSVKHDLTEESTNAMTLKGAMDEMVEFASNVGDNIASLIHEATPEAAEELLNVASGVDIRADEEAQELPAALEATNEAEELDVDISGDDSEADTSFAS